MSFRAAKAVISVVINFFIVSWQTEQKERKLLWAPVFLGLGLWAYFSHIDYQAPWFIHRKYQNYRVSGVVTDIEEFEKRQRITLQTPKRLLKLSVPNKYPTQCASFF